MHHEDFGPKKNMEDENSFSRRRMTAPSSALRYSSNFLKVSPSDYDEGFYDASKLVARSFPNLHEMRQHKDDIKPIIDLFTIEMGKQHEEKIGSYQKEVSKKLKNIDAHPDSFYSSMKPFMYLAQFCFLFSANGLTGRKFQQIQFKWLHWKVVIAVSNAIGICFLFFCSLLQALEDGIEYNKSAPLVFYSSAVAGYILFINLSQKWSTLSKNMAWTEYFLSDFGHPIGQGKKFLLITMLFSTCAFAEHIFSLLYAIMDVKSCNDANYSLLHLYYVVHYHWVFPRFDYHVVAGLIVSYFNLMATCAWNFMDLFLGLVGLALSSKLKLINDELKLVRGQEKPTIYWRKLREQYNAMSILIKSIDEDIQKLMLLSLADNLFFICLQLLKSLKGRSDIYQTTYFFWSFGFLIVRTLFVTLLAAGIYDESKDGRSALFSVPHTSYCQEVRRFLNQISYDDLALTGCKFFSVTRGLLLTIAGTVITYEIVLVQFKSDTDTQNERNNTICASALQTI